jgi:hypothetical protein
MLDSYKGLPSEQVAGMISRVSVLGRIQHYVLVEFILLHLSDLIILVDHRSIVTVWRHGRHDTSVGRRTDSQLTYPLVFQCDRTVRRTAKGTLRLSPTRRLTTT